MEVAGTKPELLSNEADTKLIFMNIGCVQIHSFFGNVIVGF